MAKPQEALPTLGDTDQFRHPMWRRPDEPLSSHVLALRNEIAKALIPFDGRPNSEQIVGWFAEVHDESIHHKAGDPIWLLGDMTWRKHLWCARLTRMAGEEKRPDRRANLVSQREAIKRLNDQLVEAVIASQTP